jgi:hypothetical protein
VYFGDVLEKDIKELLALDNLTVLNKPSLTKKNFLILTKKGEK